MESLWKETFGDSDDYIRLVFDNYFSLQTVEYHEVDGKVVSSLLAVEYDIESNGVLLKAEYICGLATRPEYRRRGLMRSLISRREESARARGVSLMLLIPADKELSAYYGQLGYSDIIGREIRNYTAPHDFEREYRMMLSGSSDRRVAELKLRYFSTLECIAADPCDNAQREAVTTFCEQQEGRSGRCVIRHSIKDFMAAIDENSVSGGKIFVIRNSSGMITAAAFCQPGYSSSEYVAVIALFASDRCSCYKVLDCAKRYYCDKGLCLIGNYSDMLPADIGQTEEFYNSPAKGTAPIACVSADVRQISCQPWMMGRIIDFDEILGFLKNATGDLKYPLLADTDEEESASVVSRNHLQALIFRKGRPGDIISSTLGIPPMGLNGYLMLD